MSAVGVPHRVAWLALVATAATAADQAAPSCPPLEQRAEAALARAIDPIVDAAVAEGFAGGVALLRDGTLAYDRAAGFSDARGRVPVTATTLFHVASVAKYLTAAVSLVSAERGRIELTGPIAPLVPGTHLAGRGLSFLDLLAHRSGLGSSHAAEGIGDAAEALQAIDRRPPDPELVGRFRYSNDGYDLLAILLERAWGRPYEELARELVLAPACLDGPRFWAEVDRGDPRLVGQPLRRIGRRLAKRNYGMVGSGGLLIGAVDLARLEHALASGRLLSPASRGELTTPRGEMRLGQAVLGAFLVDHPELGRVLSARGYDDWGDNAILNHYLDHRLILAVVTSKGPAEVAGETPAPFRSRIARAIEAVLAAAGSESPAGAR